MAGPKAWAARADIVGAKECVPFPAAAGPVARCGAVPSAVWCGQRMLRVGLAVQPSGKWRVLIA